MTRDIYALGPLVYAYAKKHGRLGASPFGPTNLASIRAALADAEREQQTLSADRVSFLERFEARRVEMSRRHSAENAAILDRVSTRDADRAALTAELARSQSAVYIEAPPGDLARRVDAFNAADSALVADARNVRARHAQDGESFTQDGRAEAQRLDRRSADLAEWVALLTEYEAAQAAHDRRMQELDQRAEAQRLGYV